MNNIYTFWWQGFEQAPEIIKICHKSLTDNIDEKNHRLIILTEKNLMNYIDLPGYIMDKHRQGKITTTHLSDIIRSTLLSLEGGLWTDASVYFTKALDNKEIFENDFFTLKRKESKEYDITNKWTCSLMAGKKDFPLFEMLRDMWFEYWKREEYLITYLLTDHVFYLAYSNNARVKQALDACPCFCYKTDYFQNMLNKPYNHKIFTEIMKKEKYCKLTYKMKLLDKTSSGYLTYYGKLKESYDNTK